MKRDKYVKMTLSNGAIFHDTYSVLEMHLDFLKTEIVYPDIVTQAFVIGILMSPERYENSSGLLM